jgi:enoyl-CoA hydratase/carnithine racemase
MKVKIVINNGIRTIRLNRPDKRNALDAEMLDALITALPKNPDQSERLAVFRAEGTVFCAGLDLTTRREISAAGESSIEAALHAIEAYPLPVVAVVQGPAIAGGCELALHCDLVVATADAHFAMPNVQIGLSPTWHLTRKFLELAGPAMTRQILMLGDAVPAARLHALGLITDAVSPDQLESAAAAIIERLAANAPLSLRAIKALINRGMAFRDEINHAGIDALVLKAVHSNDASEGRAARAEKRRPQFAGA